MRRRANRSPARRRRRPVTAAAAGFLEAGVKFLESLAGTSSVAGAIGDLVKTDPETKRPVLTIPLPGNITAERLARAVRGLLSGISSASRADLARGRG
jgi:hypothetical protein